ncbi:Arc family DNA-binding protein [Streptomyces sp. 6N223]|uniref:Arc family DNA-binding protein n=1 Tax=Streptomyces sp. 6N223 TaxID=3457412 RepID=UPI003FD3F491
MPEELHTRLADRATTDRRTLNSELLHLLETGLSAVSSRTSHHPGHESATPTPLRGNTHPRRP